MTAAAAKRYTARPNTPFTDEDAEVIGRFLDDVFGSRPYTPDDIVRIARDPGSPIHGYFEWDDTRAAQLYRLQQARKMINCVVEIIGGERDVPKAVSVFLQNEGRRAYMDTTEARQNPDIWEDVLQTALTALYGWQQRFKKLSNVPELVPVMQAIENLKQQQERKKRGKAKKTTARDQPEFIQ